MNMLEFIVSGGQTGADRAGLDAAIACGIPHGGWCPQGRRAEDGPVPERYRLLETWSPSYLDRTSRNVADSDGTVIFTLDGLTGGSWRTCEFAIRDAKPWLHLPVRGLADQAAAGQLRAFLATHGIRRLNVAGSSASRAPSLYPRVLAIMRLVLSDTEDVPHQSLFGTTCSSEHQLQFLKD